MNTNANIVCSVCVCLLAGLCFIHFERAKWMTSAFVGILLLPKKGL